MFEVALFTFSFFAITFIRFYLVKHTIPGFDTYGHTYFCQLFRQQKAGPFDGIQSGIAHSLKLQSALFFNWVVAHIPGFSSPERLKYFNFTSDLIFAIAIGATLLMTGYSLMLAGIVIILYLTTPLWFSGFAIGPRMLVFTPRLFSEIFVNIYFVTVLLPIPIDPIWLFTIATISGLLTLLSSKFGTQVLLFIAPIGSVLLVDAFIISPLIIAIGLAILLSKGRFFNTLKAHLKHLKWYFQKNLNGEMYVSNRNNPKALGLPFSKAHTVWQNIKRASLTFLSQNSYTAVILKAPIVMVMLILAPADFLASTQLFATDLLTVSLTAFAVYLLTSQKLFLFLGEAERYLSHVSVIILLSVTEVIVEADILWLAWLLIGYGIVYGVYELLNFREVLGRNDKEEQESDRLINKLSDRSEPETILLYPFHCIGGVWRVLLETPHQVLYPISLPEKTLIWYEENYAKRYPFCNIDNLEGLRRDFGVTSVVITNRHEPVWRLPKNWYTEFTGQYFTLVRYRINEMDSSS